MLLILIFPLILVPGSCKKDTICACGVEHPEVNLPWLKDLLNNFLWQDIYKFSFDSVEYIVISDIEDASDKIDLVYDCEGILICSHGGIPGSGGCNLPSSFWDYYAKNRVLIYKLRYHP